MRPFRVTIISIAVTASSLTASPATPTIELPSSSPIAAGYGLIDSVETRMSRLPLDPLEGIWEMTADGAVIAIERENAAARTITSTYRLTTISMPDRSVAPGTLMGRAIPTSDPRKFDAVIYTESADERLKSPANFIISLTDDERLSLSHYRRGLYVNLWRMVPYMFRYSVGSRDERPRGLDGMVRLYPRKSKKATAPRYL